MKHLVKAIGSAISGPKAPKIKIPAAAEPAPATPLPDYTTEKQNAMKADLMRKRTGRASTLLADDTEETL